MEARIRKTLKEIEVTHQVTILYACESGSRTWGSATEESDYDIRFIFAHPLDGYLSLDEGPDVITRTDQQFDLSGWELKKALKLFNKSNPTFLEILHSPIRYFYDTQFLERLFQVEPLLFSEKACLYHYINMAQTNFKKWKNDFAPNLKLYFHIIRPLLMALWILEERQMPPLSFGELLTNCSKETASNVDLLLSKHQHHVPLEKTAPVFKSLNAFVETSLDKLSSSNLIEKQSSKNQSLAYEKRKRELNTLFRSTIKSL